MNNRKGAIPKSTKPPHPFQKSTKLGRSPPMQRPSKSQPAQSLSEKSQKSQNQSANTTAVLGGGEESMYQCETCSVTDHADKVCCDACSHWYHFKCVNVTSEVAHRDWFCKPCIEKNQELLVSTNSNVAGAANASQVVVTDESHQNVSKPNESNSENPFGNVVDIISAPQGDVVHHQVVIEDITRSKSQSRKSTSSKASSSSRRKALALQRLEEEQLLKEMRDKEERERREEERQRRERSDKEYLDKKYSILEEESDASLSYDDYDDAFNPDRAEEIKRWAEGLATTDLTLQHIDEMPPGRDWEYFTSGKTTKIIPQMSSTNVFHQQKRKTASTMNNKPLLDSNNDGENPGRIQFKITSNDTRSAIDPCRQKPYNEKTILSNVQPSQQLFTIQSPKSKGDPLTSVGTLQNQPIFSYTDSSANYQSPWPLTTSNAKPLNSQSLDQTFNLQTLNRQETSNIQQDKPTASTGQVVSQTETSSYQQSIVQPQAVITNTHQAIINNQPFSSNRNIASNVDQLAGYAPNNRTFILDTQNPTSLSINRTWNPSTQTIAANNQSITASYQQPNSSHTPFVQSQQYQTGSYRQQQSSYMPVVSNPLVSTVNYSQSNFTPQHINSLLQPVYQNHRQSFVTTSGPYQSGVLNSQPYVMNNSSIPVTSCRQPYVMNHSTIPIAFGHQANQQLNSSSHLNYANGSYNGNYAGNSAIVPANQGQGSIQQLTAEQIAARHVVPKDLPYFSGDPREWQTFFSAYESSTTVCGYNHVENLGRIQKCLKGDASTAVKSLLVHADSVPDIINTLFMLFGRPELIIEATIQDIQKEPAPKDDDLASIMRFAIKVRNVSGTIRNTGALEHLRNPTLINSITDKLPTQIQLDWARYKRSVGVTDLAVLGEFLNQIAEAASLVVRSNISKTIVRKKEQRDNNNQQRDGNSQHTNTSKSGNYINTHVENTSKKADLQSSANSKGCPACKNDWCSKLYNCSKFKESAREDRWLLVKNNKLCTRCLGGHHFYRCKSTLTCKVEGCKAKHHTLLHNHEKTAETQTTNENKSKPNNKPVKNSVEKYNANASHMNSTLARKSERIDIFRIVPVMLFHKNRTTQIYAYLDDGSNMTTMESSLATELGLNGTYSPLCVDWAFGETHSSVESKIVSTRISGCYANAPQYNLENVRTVKQLHLPTQSITKSWIEQYSHLLGIPVDTYHSVKPRMLIGLQYSRLMVSLETIEGGEDEPIACKTRLGWVVQGPSYKTNNNPNRKYSMNICECQANDVKLHQLVKEYFAMENLDVKVPDQLLESREIQRAKQILESTTTKIDGRYETGLLWKYDRFELPDSYQMALKRLKCLEIKMAKNQQLADNLRNQMKQFVDKGYIRKLSAAEINEPTDSPIWYLPTFPAFNPKKPEKVRIVWDGAAKVMKISLNSMLLTGPDQLVPLPDVLRRFRERLYAILGDIREMYHQIKVIKADQHAQRFLWRDGDSSREPDVYVMLVVSFGLTCSPSQAQYIKNRNALEFIDKYPEAVNTIINNHYVDDMLDCEHTLDDAEKRIREVTFIHKEGGFEIRNFQSNSKELLQRIGENIDDQSKNMNISAELGTERVLGMFWNMSTDCFTFSLKYNKVNEQILSGKLCPTKREVLRILMSVFDPLGLLANYLIYAKILLQEIWRTNVDWDEQVTPPVFQKWVAWIKSLPDVEKVQIPRLYSPKLSPSPPKNIQMHIFVDAGDDAYATAIYFRIEDDDGVDCCMAGAKTKVAPNKPMSIPRLELQGAVLGTRLANSISSSQTFKINKKVYWTDSQTVMGWINSEARRYKQFVAFRIAEVLESSDQNQWRWIPSEHNVADEATKSKIAKMDSSSRWYKAPKFLYDKEDTWFKDDVEYFTEEEIRPAFTMACREIVRPQVIDLERFSQWNRLLRAQAYVFRFIYNSRNKHHQRRVGPLSQQEILNAEKHLYRRAQLDSFLDEIVIMRHNQKASTGKFKEFEKSSSLRTYSPYLDEHDVIRMKGRIDAASTLSHNTKRPIILPRRHRITWLIVDHYHRRYKHINHSTVLNEIRQKFVIPALRVVLKVIRNSCQKCKNLSVEPKVPEMAELPPARLATHTLPFTYVGVDYFGPIRVRNGRKTRNKPTVMEKRWVLLFTCLTTRAVWLEIAHSLDTNSCIMSIENFMLRKGYPREIYSDNGTSFHGADNELKAEFEKMDMTTIEEKFNSSEMKWKFNPPATPHMGGAWERLVRTVKSCIKNTINTRCPNDEMLKNFIIEAENIVNSRPLTYVSLESADEEALTPNHILLGSSNGSKPLGEFTEKDMARNTYKACQVLANNFWRRFVLEYMPTLTKRTKWFKPVEPIKVGDVVVVVDETSERNTWPKGIVEELIPGKKGIVRQVMVRTVKGLRRRSVAKLAVLEVKQPNINDGVKQMPMGSVNGEGNVGQRCDKDVNTDPQSDSAIQRCIN